MVKFLVKYNKLSLPIKATLWFAACQFLQKGISMLCTPFITRLLSTEEYGVISTFNSWEGIFLIIINLSLAKSIMNLCVKFDDRENILFNIFILSSIIFALWLVIIFSFRKYILEYSGMTAHIVYWLYLCSVFQSIITCWMARMQYEYAYRKVIIVSLLYAFLNSVGGLTAICFIARTAEVKIAIQGISLLIIGSVLYGGNILKKGRKVNIEIWKYSLGFCIPLLPHYFSEIVLSSSDRIMINSMCGASDTAIYSVAYTIGNLVGMITSAINSAFITYQYRKIKAKEYDVLAKNTNIIIFIVAGIIVLIMLFSKEIVLFFGGEKYAESVNAIIPICLGVFFNYMFQLFARVQEYFEQKYTIVIASTSCAMLNVILNYIFIQRYGYIAAAYTTFICYFIFCLLHYSFYTIACHKNIGTVIYDIKSLVFISINLCLIAITVGMFNNMRGLKYLVLLIIAFPMAFNWRRTLIFVQRIYNNGKNDR